MREQVGPIDVFICSSSFESRCLTVAQEISGLLKDKIVLICHNVDLKTHLEHNTKHLLKLMTDSNVRMVEFHNDRPIQVINQLVDKLESIKQGTESFHYLMDITTFTHEGLLLTLRVLRSILKKSDSIRFIYNEAADYSTEETDNNNKWLSKGIKEIRSVLGYAGSLRPSRKLHLIIMLGFGTERAAHLIDTFQPNIISLGLGHAQQSINTYFREINEARHIQLSSMFSNVNDFEFSCIDPEETKKNLISQIELYPNHNVIIAPLNTKISTLGAALVAFENKNVQLIYASANLYNYKGFSSPGESCYLMDLPDFIKLDPK
ncbi:hypothetical protein G3O08_17885 [Cryomorpha ignava]|uniref:Uncharacterized protein n=1 Tax=Cryomorpha ignava TaxID=101383 RepID=A0A7K3WUN5_9FLAO|nr:hypothetical protein [Cryomorpha ignava]NEN25370.1 hypothetical protein [Cryomorpha ignava]